MITRWVTIICRIARRGTRRTLRNYPPLPSFHPPPPGRSAVRDRFSARAFETTFKSRVWRFRWNKCTQTRLKHGTGSETWGFGWGNSQRKLCCHTTAFYDIDNLLGRGKPHSVLLTAKAYSKCTLRIFKPWA